MAALGHDDQEPQGRLGRLFAALVGTEGEDAAGQDTPADEGDARGFDVDALARALAASGDPASVLRALVTDTRERSVKTAPGDPGAPSGIELYLAERLFEAGVGTTGDEGLLPEFSVVRPRTSDLFYLRVEQDEFPWPSKVRLLRVEAALNGALLATRALPDGGAGATLEEVVRCEQRAARSIVAQASRVAARREGPALAEWDVREAISFGIESFQLPYRLTARFRANVSAGVVAIECDLVPPRAWAATAYVDGLGVVGATSQMRRRAATDYNLRLGVLLAAYALDVAPRVREVWVAGVVDSASAHACYYSARLTRRDLEGTDLDGSFDPIRLLRAAGAELDEHDRELSPVSQGFSLDDETLCPARRFAPVELSRAALSPQAADALGCARVRELGADERRGRREAADELVRKLSDSTQDNVRALLELARSGVERDVEEAAMRCVRALVEGTLADDPLEIAESLVKGDELSQGAEAARERLLARDMAEAERLALEALGCEGAREAAGAPERHVFVDHTERVLYNLLVAPAGKPGELAPAALLEALLVASTAQLAQEKVELACASARQARELAPLSPQTSLHLAQCLEAAGDLSAASDELARLLALAHDPETIALAYLRMAQVQWQGGRVLAAQACYQRAARGLGAPLIVAGLAVVALIGHVGSAADAMLTAEQVESTLHGANIPVAPTKEVVSALAAAARAAVDAEVFPVARDLTRSLCSIARDDVTFGVLRSLEGEPDR